MRTENALMGLAVALTTLVASIDAQREPTGGGPALGLADQTLGSPADPGTTQLFLGHDIVFAIIGAEPGDRIHLLASATGPSTPIELSGVAVVIDPLAFVVLGGQLVGASGQAAFTFTVPASMGVGQPLHVQAFSFGAAPGRTQATNGLVLSTASEPFVVLFEGGSCTAAADAVTVTNDAEWDAFWSSAFPGWPCFGPGPKPTVDFRQNAVLCVFAGSQPSTGYWLELDSVVFAGAALLVDGSVHWCDGGGATVVYPWKCVLIDAAVGAPAQLALTTQEGPCP